MKWSARIISFINKVHPAVWVVFVLSIYFLGFVLDGNEEQYLGYARKFYDPSWMAGTDVFEDFPGSRILFQWITGFFLQHFSFEQVAFWGRLISYILVAFPLAGILRMTGISNIAFLIWFPVFYLPQQSLFAGEWIFGPLESKTISYAFVLASLYFLLREKYLPSVIFAIIAVYWHLLAGGWWAFYLFVYLLLRKTSVKKVIMLAGIFLLLFLPLLFYLYSGLIKNNSPIVNGINTNYIYVFFRNPHHIGLFASSSYFFHRHFLRVIFAAGVFVAALLIGRSWKTGILSRLNLLLIIILSQVFVSLGIALFDKQGYFLKYYPFRGNGLAMLLFQLEGIILLSEFVRKKAKVPGDFIGRITGNSLVVLLVLIVSYGFLISGRIGKRKTDQRHAQIARTIAEDIKREINREDEFLLLCEDPDNILSIPRISERKPFVVYRFVPTRADQIYEWYRKVLLNRKVQDNPGLLLSDSSLKNIRAVVSCRPLEGDFLRLISVEDYLYLYKVVRGKESAATEREQAE